MDKAAFREMFFRVDRPIAESLSTAVHDLVEGDCTEQCRAAEDLCHRLRGDARSIGFHVLGDLIEAMEHRLGRRGTSEATLTVGDLAFLRRSAEEVVRRMRGGELSCEAPLHEEVTEFKRSP